MAEDAGLLPSFNKPPVGEVALLAQFDRIDSLRNADYLRLWGQSEYKTLYPTIGEYVEMRPFRESFGTPKPPPGFVSLEFPESFEPVARYNFRSNERSEQVQFQRDRIGYYWQAGKGSYPRYEMVAANFKRDYLIFEGFMRERQWSVVPNQCSISYSNRIPKSDGWETLEDIQNVFTFWKAGTSRALLPDVSQDDFGAKLTYLISGNGQPLARMYVTAVVLEPPHHPTGAILFDLIFRGPPRSRDLNGILEFFELGRRHIVTTFEALTTPTMHNLWGKQ